MVSADCAQLTSNVSGLNEATKTFFDLHWPPFHETDRPQWSADWLFQGSIPNYDKGGCYALFCGDRLLYIGVAEANIADRTNSYTRAAAGAWMPPQTRHYEPSGEWVHRGLDRICTIGFAKFGYLAPALESWLIVTLQPPFNINKKSGGKARTAGAPTSS